MIVYYFVSKGQCGRLDEMVASFDFFYTNAYRKHLIYVMCRTKELEMES